MKYEGLTLEFVNFIDKYKIEKTEGLIKKIFESLDGINEKQPEDEKKRQKINYTNILGKIDISQFIQSLESALVLDGQLFFYHDAEKTIEWINKLQKFKTEWLVEQEKSDFKVQNLRIKIANAIKKSFVAIETYEENSKAIKDKIDFSLDSYLLSFDLDKRLIEIKYKEPLFLEVIDKQSQLWIEELDGICKKYNYATWLNWASENSINVGFSTHVAKLTHSSIKGGSSVYFDKDESPCYLTTTSLEDKSIDISQTNNLYAPIGILLKLEFNGHNLADKLSIGDVSNFEDFAKDQIQLEKWRNGFLSCFSDKKPSSHSLAKQIYYPVDENYHLLSPLASSSLDQAIFDLFRYSDKNQEIWAQRKQNKYHCEHIVTYPNKAFLKVTSGDKTSKAHMNVSPLNQIRVGKRYLFPSTPPSWKSQLKPPSTQESLFDGEFNHRAWQSVKQLKKYLLDIRNQNSTKEIRDHVKNCADEIIGILFNYVSEIQNLPNQSGWSQRNTKLKESHQLWLEPYRQDDSFQQKRQSGDWQAQVSKDFGSWLNHQLKHDKLSFSKIEADTWAKFLLKRLREFERDLEVTL